VLCDVLKVCFDDDKVEEIKVKVYFVLESSCWYGTLRERENETSEHDGVLREITDKINFANKFNEMKQSIINKISPINQNLSHYIEDIMSTMSCVKLQAQESATALSNLAKVAKELGSTEMESYVNILDAKMDSLQHTMRCLDMLQGDENTDNISQELVIRKELTTERVWDSMKQHGFTREEVDNVLLGLECDYPDILQVVLPLLQSQRQYRVEVEAPEPDKQPVDALSVDSKQAEFTRTFKTNYLPVTQEMDILALKAQLLDQQKTFAAHVARERNRAEKAVQETEGQVLARKALQEKEERSQAQLLDQQRTFADALARETEKALQEKDAQLQAQLLDQQRTFDAYLEIEIYQREKALQEKEVAIL
jgi:hypothetical protein